MDKGYRAIEEITFYVNEHLDINKRQYYPKYYFDILTYSRWACFEIIKRIEDDVLFEMDYLLIIAMFIIELDHCIRLSKNDSVQQAFTISKKTAEEICSLLNDVL